MLPNSAPNHPGFAVALHRTIEYPYLEGIIDSLSVGRGESLQGPAARDDKLATYLSKMEPTPAL